MYHFSHLGVKKDYVEALKWYRKAAEQGDVYSGYYMNMIGGIYEAGGFGVEQDYAEAVKWHRKSAAQGYYGGDLRLGWCYRDGKGVKQDHAEAVKWYRKAADQGRPEAQKDLEELLKLIEANKKAEPKKK